MKKAGVRLSVGHSLSPSVVEDVASEGTNSASLARAERQIKTLQEENSKLRNNLSEMSLMYHQLVKEASHEQYDERRVTVLKAHIIQLERQMITLAEAQSSRASSLMEVENALTAIADCARLHLTQQKSVGSSVGQIPIPCSDVNRIVETAESARIKLFKSIENTNPEKLQRPLLMMDRFVKQSPWTPVSMLDVCSGKLEHLNLKHVGKLESKLAKLYKQLMLVNLSLHSIVSPSKDDVTPVNQELPSEVYIRLAGEVSRACTQLKSTTSDLLDLSILVPAAPWPPLQKPYLHELTTDRVMKSLPSFPKGKVAEGRHLIDVLMKAIAYDNHMKSLELESMDEELRFHQAVYSLQVEYVQALFTSVREGYVQFEDNTHDLLCKPLTVILTKYGDLKKSASEDDLREFLSVFKCYSDQIEEAVNILQPKETKGNKGEAAVSQFGESFFESLKKIQQACQAKRESLVNDIKIVKEKRQSHIDEMLQIFLPCEEQEQNKKAEYDDIVNKTAELSIDGTPEARAPGNQKATSTLMLGKTSQNAVGVATARGRRRSSIPNKDRSPPCNCGTEDSQDGDQQVTCRHKNQPIKHKGSPIPNKRLSLVCTGNDKDGLKAGQIQLRKASKLPSKGTGALATPGSRSSSAEGERDTGGSKLGGQKSAVRPSFIPSITPRKATKQLISPSGSGRLTPMSKLTLKPTRRRTLETEVSTLSDDSEGMM